MRVDFVIVTALEEERDAVLSKLTSWRKLPPTREDVLVYFDAKLPVYADGRKTFYRIIILCLSGMGRVEAVTAAKDAINHWTPGYVLLVGIAAGFDKNEARLGDVLIADQVVDYELQKVSEVKRRFRWLDRLLGAQSQLSYRPKGHPTDARFVQASLNFIDKSWISLIGVARPDGLEPVRLIGPMATGDKVVASRSLVNNLLKMWPKLIGLEMEAGGVAVACFRAATGPRFFMIRGVSDLADENKGSASVTEWRTYAANVAAAYAIGLLQSGPVPIDTAVSEFKDHTDRAINAARIRIAGLAEPIQRDEVVNVEGQLNLGRAVVLTGEPGTGKSGIGHVLALSARRAGKEVLFFDARWLEHVKDESGLRSFFLLNESISSEIGRLGSTGGCRLIIDQLDSVVRQPVAKVLTNLARDCSTLEGVEVIVISRRREGDEAEALLPLLENGFYELESRSLSVSVAVRVLAEIGITSPPEKLIERSQNLLNLELIAKIKKENAGFNFADIEDEVALWEKYREVLTASASDGEELLAEAVRLARDALNSDEGSFTLPFPLTHQQIRLESWGVIAVVQEYGRVYTFAHEKLQDYFYAWDAAQRQLMAREVMREINRHRSGNVLEWMKRIYARHSSELYERFLKEALYV